MANENEELQRQMEELRQSMQGLDEVTNKTTVGMAGLASATKGIGQFAKSVGQGDTSFKSLNTIVDVAANAMSGLAKSIPYAGEALAAGIKATAEASKFMLEQMDQSTKAFNDLSKVGALTADGMTGLQRQFLTSGLQLGTFSKQIAENSIALARFRGLTGEGAEDFAKVTGALTQGTDDSLRRLGMSSEQIGETVGAFVTQQTRLGRAQNMTNADLIAGTKQYAMELDQLQKVTGMSREQIQKQQDAALSESRFRANYDELVAQGREKEAKALMDLQTRMNSFGAELGQGTRDLASGAANTDAARRLMASTGGAAQDIIERLKSGAIDQNQAQKELQAATRANAEAQRGNAKFVDAAASSFSNYAQVSDFNSANIEESGMKAKTVQDKQLKGQDKLTEDTISAQKSMEKMNIEIQKLGFTFLPKAASATAAMTSAMTKFVEYVNKTIDGDTTGGANAGESPWDVPGVSPEFGGSTGTGMDMGGAEIMGAAGGGSPPPGPGPGGGKMGAADLKKMGLKIKEGDVQADNSEISPKLIALAKKIQSEIPGFAYFSGFNDKYHQENSGSSQHTKGLALDFALGQAPSAEQGSKIADMLRGLGANYVQDEYNNPSSKSTAGHFHASVSAKNGAILSGPLGGYKPNLTMHGTEAIVPLNSGGAGGAIGGSDPAIMMAQLEKLDELVSVMKSQVGISTKLLQMQS